MGNQVIIAIRHDIDQNNIPEFSNQELMGLHEGERVPKSFITHNGIIVSVDTDMFKYDHILKNVVQSDSIASAFYLYYLNFYIKTQTRWHF